MKPIRSLWLAISLVLLITSAQAETRPHYGGALRVAIAEPLSSLDPADASNISGETAIHKIASLLFDTLTTLDRRGEPQPALATSWKSDFNSQRWELQLRAGVKFSDGTALTADSVAASLRVANPHWNVSAAGDSVVIESDTPDASLPAELALLQNSIALRTGGRLAGTGPFIVTQWDANKNLTLAARDDDWAGRPFIDSLEISIARLPRDEMLSLDLGKVDVIEAAAEQMVRTASTVTSAPDQLLALMFMRNAQSPEEMRLRQALSSAIDRNSLNGVVLQGTGEPAGSLLPNWMTGYGFLFSSSFNLDHARQTRAGANQASSWKIGYDMNDPIARVVSERIVLNAQDAGLNIQPATTGVADIKLVRISLISSNANIALTQLATRLQLPPPSFHGDSAESLYSAESALLQSQRVIPLLHLRTAVVLDKNVHGWNENQDGNWDLPNVWLSMEKNKP
jgi:MarR-like DNA-binding transcriptional regulator SgrR of sgrS sRNA